jgi:protein O-mannosyl-transferase
MKSIWDKRKMIGISLVVLAVVTACAFVPALDNEFTNWDDDRYVTDNTLIRGLSWDSLQSIARFGSYLERAQRYCPLTILSFAVEYHFAGLNPRVYHGTNLVLHILNSLLVFWFIILITRELPPSLIVAFLFALHPLHVESVAWVTERKDVLYSFFFLLSLIAYSYYGEGKHKALWYASSLILFFLSLLAKPMALTLTAVLLLIDYLKCRSFNARLFLEKAPFFVGSLAGAFVLISGNDRMGGGDNILISPLYNVILACHSVCFYILKLMAPVHLSAIYPHPPHTTIATLPLEFLISPLCVVALAAIVAWTARRSRKVVFGSLFFIVTLLPVSQIIPVPPGVAADRYTYIPFIGLFYLIGEGILFLLTIIRHRALKLSLCASLIVILCLLSFLTSQRCTVWKDSLTLWNDVIKNYPTTPIAYNKRGTAFLDKGIYREAMADFNRALAFKPDDAELYNNRGIAFSQEGDFARAIADYNRSLEIRPGAAIVHYNRGNALRDAGALNDAIKDYSQAIEAAPSNLMAYYQRGCTYGEVKSYDRAIMDLSYVLRARPDDKQAAERLAYSRSMKKEFDDRLATFDREVNQSQSAESYHGRGMLYASKGVFDRALSDLTRALELAPRSPNIFLDRGTIYFMRRDLDRAISDYSTALSLDPKAVKVYYNRGLAYFRKGELGKSISDFCTVETMEGPSPALLKSRGLAYASFGNSRKALDDFDWVIRMNPDDSEARFNRGTLLARKGDYQRALGDFSYVLSKQPSHKEALYRRAAIYHLCNKPDNADKDLETLNAVHHEIDRGRIDDLIRAFKASKEGQRR